jgi:hypothetical protein
MSVTIFRSFASIFVLTPLKRITLLSRLDSNDSRLSRRAPLFNFINSNNVDCASANPIATKSCPSGGNPPNWSELTVTLVGGLGGPSIRFGCGFVSFLGAVSLMVRRGLTMITQSGRLCIEIRWFHG